MPRWQRHSEQNSLFRQGPQQSPPSKLQLGLLVSSLQYPSPTNGFVMLYSSTSDWRHVHSEQWLFRIHDPQQSPPSKLHPWLFASSSQNPSPINNPCEQSWNWNEYSFYFCIKRNLFVKLTQGFVTNLKSWISSILECPKSLKMFKLDLTWSSRSDWTWTWPDLNLLKQNLTWLELEVSSQVFFK